MNISILLVSLSECILSSATNVAMNHHSKLHIQPKYLEFLSLASNWFIGYWNCYCVKNRWCCGLGWGQRGKERKSNWFSERVKWTPSISPSRSLDQCELFNLFPGLMEFLCIPFNGKERRFCGLWDYFFFCLLSFWRRGGMLSNSLKVGGDLCDIRS